jgi:hypothetical protein
MVDRENLYFVNGSAKTNYYDPVSDIILIDENLEDYPLAKDYIVEHELKHQEYRLDIVDDLVHEFKNDLVKEFSFSDTAVELREYIGDEVENLDAIFYFKMFLMSALRNTWTLFLVPLGSIYRRIYKWRYDL